MQASEESMKDGAVFGDGLQEKIRLLALLESSRRATMKALNGVNDRAVVHAESGWRVQDILGHIASWEREILASLQAYHEGDEYSLGDDYVLDLYNESTYEKRRNYDAMQCRVDWGMVRRDLQFAVNDIAPERLAGPLRFPWGATGSVTALVEELVQHEQEHLMEILAALDLDSADL